MQVLGSKKMKRELFVRKGFGERKEVQGGLWWRLRKNYLMFAGWGEPGWERGGGPAPVRPGEPHWGWRPGVPLPSPPRLLRPSAARAGPAQGTPFPQRGAFSRPPRNGWPEITFRTLPFFVYLLLWLLRPRAFGWKQQKRRRHCYTERSLAAAANSYIMVIILY